MQLPKWQLLGTGAWLLREYISLAAGTGWWSSTQERRTSGKHRCPLPGPAASGRGLRACGRRQQHTLRLHAALGLPPALLKALRETGREGANVVDMAGRAGAEEEAAERG